MSNATGSSVVCVDCRRARQRHRRTPSERSLTAAVHTQRWHDTRTQRAPESRVCAFRPEQRHILSRRGVQHSPRRARRADGQGIPCNAVCQRRSVGSGGLVRNLRARLLSWSESRWRGGKDCHCNFTSPRQRRRHGLALHETPASVPMSHPGRRLTERSLPGHALGARAVGDGAPTQQGSAQR